MSENSVTVIGSYNVGLFLKGVRLPKKGETVIGHTFHEGGGGKGSNQAIAASCLGADVTFVGRIGNDKYGDAALAMYDRYGVSKERITVDKTIHTGISVILIDDNGDNLISVVPGANFNLSKEDIDGAEKVLKNSGVVGFQLESNIEIVEYGIEKCGSLGVQVLLDPAPARELPESMFPHITYMKPNEHEASVITGIEVVDRKSAMKAGQWLLDRGVSNVIITLGEKGSVMMGAEGDDYCASCVVHAADTTGAGDIFSGGLMAALTQGRKLDEAIRFANCAAGVSVTKIGVIESIPTPDELNKMLIDMNLRNYCI